MYRYQLIFSKEGLLRYVSHLDLMKAFMRAMRRAGLPLAYSQGFNPHPRFSIAAPLPVGGAGQRELAEMELTSSLPPVQIREELNRTLPEGLRVLAVELLPDRHPPLMSLVEAAEYDVYVQLRETLSPGQVQDGINSLLEQDQVMVIREKEGRKRQVDIRPGIREVAAIRSVDGELVLHMHLALGSRLNVRPEEVVQALAGFWRVDIPPGGVLCTRKRVDLRADV